MSQCPLCEREFDPGEFFFSWKTGWVVTPVGQIEVTRAEADILLIVRNSPNGITGKEIAEQYVGVTCDYSNPIVLIRTIISNLNKKLIESGYCIRKTHGKRPVCYILVRTDA